MDEPFPFPKMPGTDPDKGLEELVQLIQGESDYRSACPLPYTVIVQASGLEPVQHELPQFLHALARDQEGHWTLDLRTPEAHEYVKAHPECQRYMMEGDEYVMRDDRRVRNPGVMPLAWVLRQLEGEGHFPALHGFKFKYESKNEDQWYAMIIGVGLHTEDWGTQENPYANCQTHLGRVLREKRMQDYRTVVHTAMFDYRVGIPILQKALKSMTNDDGFSVLCIQHRQDEEAPEGLLFSPKEFANMPLGRIAYLGKEMEKQGPREI